MTSESRTLERGNRLTQAVTDLMDSQTAHGRMLMRLLDRTANQLAGIRTALFEVKTSIRDLASEQVLLGNRVESVFNRAMRACIRLDDIEDAAAGAAGDPT